MCSGPAIRSKTSINRWRRGPPSATASLFVAAMREWKRSFQNARASFVGLQSRIEKVLDVSIAREIEKLESNLLVLATVASAGPFIGLFGTVWGIMTSFRSIAASKNTSLAVVAPGIAEALLATAIGLFAAIPALIAYNKLSGDVAKSQARMESFADEFSAILSRQIDQHAGSATERRLRRRIEWECRYPRRQRRRRRRGVPRYRAMADINMTPFIDVMLVLLIIFMVAAPLLSSGVPIDLPSTKAGELNIDKKPIAVSIDDHGDVYLMDQKIADSDLISAVQAQAKDGVDERVYVRASKLVAYGRVAEVMSDLTAAGFKKVALVTNQQTTAKGTVRVRRSEVFAFGAGVCRLGGGPSRAAGGFACPFCP